MRNRILVKVPKPDFGNNANCYKNQIVWPKALEQRKLEVTTSMTH